MEDVGDDVRWLEVPSLQYRPGAGNASLLRMTEVALQGTDCQRKLRHS